jgi:hypothetical protein
MVPQEANDAPMAQEALSPRAGLRLLAAGLLAIGLVIAVALPVIAIVSLDGAIDLSKQAKIGIKSGFPDVEASLDGQYVAVVWSRGYDAESTTKDYGYIVLKSARPITGWENQVKVFTPTASVWGVSPRAAFDPLDSGKLYVAWVQCQATVAMCNKIMATTCTLTDTDRCAAPETVYSQTSGSAIRLSAPDIAADNAGQLHVIWKNETSGGYQGIQYARKSGGSWGSPSYVSAGANAYSPALAWASGVGGISPSGHGRLHLVWYQFDPTAASRRIEYRADNPDSPGWDGSPAGAWKAPLSYKFTGDSGEPTIKPSLAASGTTVYLAWDVYSTIQPNRFHLACNYSSDSGDSWQDPSGGSGLGIPAAFVLADAYLSPIDSIDEEDTLRPSIAISGTGPVVTWHYSGTLEVGIFLKHVQLVGYREGSDALNWGDPITVTEHLNYDGQSQDLPDDSADPGLAIAPGSGVHLVHLGMWGRGTSDPDWDVYYRGDITVDNSTDDAGIIYLPMILKNSR